MKTFLGIALCLCLAGAVVAAQLDTSGTDDKPNDARAVGMVRTLNTAEAYYANHYPEVGFACTLAQMGEDGSGKPSAEAAGLIARELVSGHVAGYNMAVNCGADDQKPYSRVTIYAAPVNPNTGSRAFCSELTMPMGKMQGGLISYAKDGKAETCFIKGTPLR